MQKRSHHIKPYFDLKSEFFLALLIDLSNFWKIWAVMVLHYNQIHSKKASYQVN